MALRLTGFRCPGRAGATGIVAAALWLAGAGGAAAQGPSGLSILSPGDAVVTGFSGTLPPNPPPAAGSDPLDETFIDIEGASMRVLRLQPFGPLAGQLIPSPLVFSVRAADVGQVFAATLDDAAAPNIYLGATAAFGLRIVAPDSDGDGRPERVTVGQPGAAFMDGQWGTAKGGSPGSIYRVDGVTGDVSLFSTIGVNAGPGLGDVVFDRVSRQFFVSDLDTGLIFRLNATGAILDNFDHGMAGRPARGLAQVPDDGVAMNVADPAFNATDPSTWGFTPKERRIGGMAVNLGRLFYAVFEPLQIWSIGINPDGTFANDARPEIEVTGIGSVSAISDITFDTAGAIVLAQRGEQSGGQDYVTFAVPLQSAVMRYKRETPDNPATPGAWVPVPDLYAVGSVPDYRNANGGVAIGPGVDSLGRPTGRCTMIWSSAEALEALSNPTARIVGLQGNDLASVRPANVPPQQTYVVDYDQLLGEAALSGHVGDVEIWQDCSGTPEPVVVVLPPPPPVTTNLVVTKKVAYPCSPGAVWNCIFDVVVTNAGPEPVPGPIEVVDDSGFSAGVGTGPGVTCQLAPTQFTCIFAGELKPGESFTFQPQVNVPNSPVTCEFPNTVTVTSPPNGPGNNPAQATAPAFIPDPTCPPPPSDLVIAKKADGDCVAAAGGYDCKYIVSVINNGPAFYVGPVKVTDSTTSPVGSLAVDLSSGAAWTCPPSPTSAQCSIASANLAVGDSLDLKVVLTIGSGDVGKAACEVPNAATLDSPAGAPAASATAKLNDPNCIPPTNLALAKADAGDCTLTGEVVGCDYEITITNTTANPYKGLIPVSDSPGLVGTVTLTPNDPGWTCPPGLNQCEITDFPGGATATFKAHVEVALMAIQANGCKLDNTVLFPGPLDPIGNTDTSDDTATATATLPPAECATPAAPSDLTVSKTAQSCVKEAGPGWRCSYTVELSNKGPGAFGGTIEISEKATSPDVKMLDPSIGKCLLFGAAFQNEASCNLTIGLFKQGGVLTFPVEVIAPDYLADPLNPSKCQIQNTVRIVTAGGPTQNSDTSNDSDDATASLPCDTNLRVEKTAEPVCVAGPTNWQCAYNIRITNTGQLPYSGNITIRDGHAPEIGGVAAGTSLIPSTCTWGTGEFFCNLTDVKLGAGESLDYPAYLNPGNEYPTDIGKCKIMNTATIIYPVGPPFNTNGSDDLGIAFNKIPMIPVDGPIGTYQVPCDPPSFSIEKVANPPQCAKAAGGFDCAFDVTITSLGPDPYLGTIHIDEIAPTGTTLKSYSPPWQCVGGGTDAHCTYDALPLTGSPPVPTFAVGEKVSLKVVLFAPDTYASARRCSVANQVAVTIPAEVLHGPEGAKYRAGASAQIPAEYCGAQPGCQAAQTRPDGTCCPGDQTWNGNSCGIAMTTVCPAGTTGVYPRCMCPNGQFATGNPLVCPTIVIDRCPVAGTSFRNGQCLCANGRSPTGNPLRCGTIIVDPGPRCTVQGTSLKNGQCLCSNNEPPFGNPLRCPTTETPTETGCPNGLPRIGGICLSACPADSTGISPFCRCKQGTHGRPGQCVQDSDSNDSNPNNPGGGKLLLGPTNPRFLIQP